MEPTSPEAAAQDDGMVRVFAQTSPGTARNVRDYPFRSFLLLLLLLLLTSSSLSYLITLKPKKAISTSAWPAHVKPSTFASPAPWCLRNIHTPFPSPPAPTGLAPLYATEKGGALVAVVQARSTRGDLLGAAPRASTTSAGTALCPSPGWLRGRPSRAWACKFGGPRRQAMRASCSA